MVQCPCNILCGHSCHFVVRLVDLKMVVGFWGLPSHLAIFLLLQIIMNALWGLELYKESSPTRYLISSTDTAALPPWSSVVSDVVNSSSGGRFLVHCQLLLTRAQCCITGFSSMTVIIVTSVKPLSWQPWVNYQQLFLIMTLAYCLLWGSKTAKDLADESQQFMMSVI